MKRLLFLLFLLQSVTFFAQQEDLHIIKIKPEIANKYFIHSFHEFYIDTIIDNRPIKTSNFGIVKKGLTGDRRLKVRFEKDSINIQLKALFNEYTIEKETKTPIIAIINFFEIGEFTSNVYKEEGFVYLDIDYFLKSSNGEHKKVGHYHGKLFDTFGLGIGMDVTAYHSERIFYILKKSLDNIKLTDNITYPQKNNFIDTSYIPKKGFYRSFLDYQYNTPIKTQHKYSVVYKKFKEQCTIKTKKDSLSTNIFGYSDGNNFYTYYSNMTWKSQLYNIVNPKGRFLFMENAVLDLSADEVLGKAVLETALGAAFGVVGGVVGGVTAGTNKTGNAIFDLNTGKAIRVDSKDFLSFLNQEDEAIYKEYQASKRQRVNAIIAVEKLNVLYHNKN